MIKAVIATAIILLLIVTLWPRMHMVVLAEPFQVSGDVTWKLSTGLGDPDGLIGMGIAPGRFTFSQRLRVTLSGEVIEGLRLDANLDNLQSDNLQVASLTLTRGAWSARVGDFRFTPKNPLTATGFSLKGLTLNGPTPGGILDMTAARAQGTPVVKEFKGGAGEDRIRYVRGGSVTPERHGPDLEANIQGSHYVELPILFDPDFSDVFVVWEDAAGGRTLRQVLQAHNLGPLYRSADTEPGAPTGVLAAGDAIRLVKDVYVAWTRPGSSLLLWTRPLEAVLRQTLEELIRQYNVENQLSGKDRLVYPYSPNTASDRALLQDLLVHHTALAVGREPDQSTRVGQLVATRQDRYFDLGHRNIQVGTEKVTVQKDGAEVPASQVLGLSVAVYYDEGVLDLGPDAPTALKGADAVIVSYRYQLDSNLYFLGGSLTVGSEKVFLNGQRLEVNIDYIIDYEFGLLHLLVPVNTQDVLRVEYESFRGGLGRHGEYQRHFYAAQAEFAPWPGWEVSLDLLTALDTAPDRDRDLRRTMPNTHVVGGVRAQFHDSAWDLDLQVAHSFDQYPFDANARVPQANSIRSMDGGTWPTPFLAAGHGNGLQVWIPTKSGPTDPGDVSQWRAYQLGQGLAGTPVNQVLIDEPGGFWFLATGGGLTVIDMRAGSLPDTLDLSERWSRYYTGRGLPSNNIHTVAVFDERVWAGTADGLASAARAAFPGRDVIWRTESPGVGNLVRALAVAPHPQTGEAALWVAGDGGLALRKGGGAFEPLVAGVPVHALGVPPTDVPALPVYVGGPQGLFRLQPDGLVPVGSVPAVRALQYWQGVLWIATELGLWAIQQPGEADPAQLQPRLVGLASISLASLGVGPAPTASNATALWAGTAGEYRDDIAFWVVTSGQPTPGDIFPVKFAEAGLDAEDAYRFQDPPDGANAHTKTGWKGAASVFRQFGGASAYVQALRQDAAFLPIGGTEREDVTMWEIGGNFPIIEPIRLSVHHREETRVPINPASGGSAKASSIPVRKWTDGMAVTWSVGPDIEVAYRVTQEDRSDLGQVETQEDRYSATLRQSVWANQVRWGAGIEHVIFRHWRQMSENYRAENLVFELDTRVAEQVDLHLRYRRPIRVEGPNAATALWEDSLQYTLGWNRTLRNVRMQVAFEDQFTLQHAPLYRSVRTQQAQTRADLPAWQIGRIGLTPKFRTLWRALSGWHLTNQNKVEVGTELGVVWANTRVDLDTGLTHTAFTESGKEEWQVRHQVLTRLPAWGFLMPMVEWGQTHRHVWHPTLGLEEKAETTGALRVDWQFTSRTSATTVYRHLVRHERQGAFGESIVEGTLRHEVRPGTQVQLFVQHRDGNGSGLGSTFPNPHHHSPRQTKVEVSGSSRISDRWNVNLSVGSAWGERQGKRYLSHFLEGSAQLVF